MLVSKHFTSDGTWTCPAGVSWVYVLGHGGGAGGSRGPTGTYTSNGAGMGTVPMLYIVPVVPNTTYSISIGQGGLGQTALDSKTAGGDSTFGSLVMPGAPVVNPGALSGKSVLGVVYQWPGTGANGADVFNRDWQSGWVTTTITNTVVLGPYKAGLNGCPGDFGSLGGVGGNTAGVPAGNGTGYGAGGGSGVAHSSSPGDGGNGSQGQVWVIWVE